MNLGREIVANATKALTHDRSHTTEEHWYSFAIFNHIACSTHV